MTGVRPLLAHQGGWDELLLFGLPVLLALAAVRLVERRNRRRGRPNASEDGEPTEHDGRG